MIFPKFSSSSNSHKPTLSEQQGENTTSEITGKFDPTALERGAKALKQLDASPNAGKAFEIIKQQEATRQKELLKEIEQAQNDRIKLQAEKLRFEAEEKKLMKLQSEEDKQNAKFKAQLDAESYAKKLKEQQKQNEAWIKQQHQQFLKQEEIRAKTEAEILQMKNKQLRDEKLIQQELLKTKIKEESIAERANADIRLKKLQAQAAEDRQTRLLSLQTTFSSIGKACNQVLDDPAKRQAIIWGISFTALGIYGARAATSIARTYIETNFGKPTLIRETSRWQWKRHFLSYFSKTPNIQEEIVLPKELAQRLEWTTNSIISSKANKTPYRHLLLYGNPGTGKTLFARTLARSSGLDYAIMSGGDVGPLGKQAVEHINKIFKWANKSKKGLILFIDEAEAFLRKGRESSSQNFSEDLRNCLASFLYHTGTESNNVSLLLATNLKDTLDPAVLDRIDDHFEFPLPKAEERLKMLQLFFDKYISQSGKRKIVIDPKIDKDYLRELAEKTEGFSGRQLAKLIIGMQAAVYGSGSKILTKGLADLVVSWKIKEFKDTSMKT